MQTENFEFIDDEYIEKQILFQELQDNLTNNYECKKDENPNIISTKPTEQKSDQNKNKYQLISIWGLRIVLNPQSSIKTSF